MVDPFSDIDGIVHVKEEEVPIAESSLLSTAASAPSPTHGHSYVDRFPKEIQEKVAHDLKTRIELEKAIHSAMTELHSVREQLYVIRWDTSRPEDQVRQDIENHISEIDRLESKVSKLREKLLEHFIFSLSLEKVKMSSSQVSALLNLKMNSSSVTQPRDRLFSEGALAPPNQKFGRLKSREQLERTVASEEGHVVEKDEPSMFRKLSSTIIGSHVKHPASLQVHVTPKSPNYRPREAEDVTDIDQRKKLVSEEIATLRVTLYHLKQQKELTPKEEELLEITTAKLRALTEL